MKKILLLLLCVSACAALLFGCSRQGKAAPGATSESVSETASQGETNTGKKDDNKGAQKEKNAALSELKIGSLKFEVPLAWESSKSETEHYYYTESGDTLYVSMEATEADELTQTIINDYLSANLKEDEDIKDLRILSEEDMLIAGSKAFRSTAAYTLAEKKVFCDNYFFIHDGELYNFFFYSNSSKRAAAFENSMEAIISSASF